MLAWLLYKANTPWFHTQFAKAHGTTKGEEENKPEQGSKRGGMAELLDGPPKQRFYEAVTVTEL